MGVSVKVKMPKRVISKRLRGPMRTFILRQRYFQRNRICEICYAGILRLLLVENGRSTASWALEKPKLMARTIRFLLS